MNTLKPLLICAVLAGIGYGVYVRINSGNDAPPPGAPQDWNSSPEIQMGDSTSPADMPTWPAGAGAAGGAAPPFAPPGATGGASQAGGEAPPFAAPGASPSSTDAAGNAPPFDNSASAPAAPGQTPDMPVPGDRYAPPAAPANPADAPAAAGAAMPDRYQTPESAAADRYATPDAAVPDRYQTPDSAPADRYGTPEGSTPGGSAAEAGGVAPAATPREGTFAETMETAKRELEVGQMATALEKLSQWYDDPSLTPAEEQQLNQFLDQVAGTVIYSTQHLLEPPYEVRPGERLEEVAQQYDVPWQLLAKINGIDDPNSLRPGERLKVVRGPFNAVVNLQKRELTLVLANGSYAGRFPIGIGTEQPPREGTYTVSDKLENPVYHGREKVVGAGEAGNPLGNRWIGLGSDLGIHGTDRPENIGRTDLPGSISLGPRDVEDVYDILATGSQVTIRR